MEDIKALLPSITEAIFTHTRCQANSIAHRLARFGLSLSQECEWDVSPPLFISDLLLEECMLP
ncbi:hypothetical protein D8674_013963 [Pyrus ussuriensis x Pyrus communis]|uniref:RNase H type-1 domain-containing protein n=1 Tax=Pyrus ussuriensis x Pyrus communis TaxID=2448454 RepID=A0A5N5H4N2_9ROSA|nr:hypothetical protein D8674_013963 [Pyrus ussuriensis x Pyrus communis]